MKNNDYKIIASLLHEYKDKELSNEYIKTCLDWIDIISLFKCLYFIELEKDHYKELYYKTKSDLIDRKYFTF